MVSWLFESGGNSLFAEGVQAGQDLGVVIVIQADAADQELFVYLTHHRAGAPRLTLCHGNRHPKPRTATPANLQQEMKRNRQVY